MNRRQASSLIDMKLVTRDGDLLGSVDELLIELESGRIAYVIVQCRDGRRLTIPWQGVECEPGQFRLRANASG
jgi:sporulation protein YlmC with PRC-barrel domain